MKIFLVLFSIFHANLETSFFWVESSLKLQSSFFRQFDLFNFFLKLPFFVENQHKVVRSSIYFKIIVENVHSRQCIRYIGNDRKLIST